MTARTAKPARAKAAKSPKPKPRRAKVASKARPSTKPLTKPRAKIAAGWVEARIYMPRSLHDFLKKAAESRGLSFSDFCRHRLLSSGELVVRGDFAIAPPETPAPEPPTPSTPPEGSSV